MKNNKAITLVALIITVIVLLILATVSINLVINGGIIDKSKSAVDKYSEEEIKEQIRLAYLELETEKLYNTNVNEVSFLTSSLEDVFGQGKVSVEKVDKTFEITINIKGKDKEYTIDATGTVAVAPEKWKMNADGSFSKWELAGIQIGDTVKYETILNKAENAVDSTKLAQLKSDLSTYSGDSESSDNAGIDRDNLTWKVLDIKDGKIRLINETLTASKIKLSGYDGYNNAVYLLDEVCDILYSVNSVGKAQNLKIEDIEDKIDKDKFDYAGYVNGANITYGENKEYTFNLNYPRIYIREVGCKAVTTADNTENILGLSQQTSTVEGKNIATNRLKTTQTYWGDRTMKSTEFINSIYYTLFNKGSNWLWLSSRCVDCSDKFVDFRVYAMSNGSIYGQSMFLSRGDIGTMTCTVGPVITLSSDVELEADGTNTWKIK